MSLDTEEREITDIVNRMLDNLSLSISSQTGVLGSAMRQHIGLVRANFMDYLDSQSFTIELLACFTAAATAKVKLSSLFYVHEQLFKEMPAGFIAKAIVQLAIVYCLTTESRMITLITFTSRDDVEVMIKKMKAAFDFAREIAADAQSSATYQTLTYLAGSLTNYLAKTARPLPRMITFRVAATMPVLTLSNRFYYEADRWEELVEENRIVHPAFCMRELRGLSA